jgi:uncharacterized protein YndB with AHSA1/START domain
MEVEREIVVPETPDEVWEALTDPERLEEWFASEVELDARPGGEGVFRWGDGDERRALVREVEEAERLVLDWDDGGTVAIELETSEDGTRVRVGVADVAPPGCAFAWTATAAAPTASSPRSVMPGVVHSSRRSRHEAQRPRRSSRPVPVTRQRSRTTLGIGRRPAARNARGARDALHPAPLEEAVSGWSRSVPRGTAARGAHRGLEVRRDGSVTVAAT